MADAHSDEPLVYEPMQLPPRRNLDNQAAIRWLREGKRYFDNARGISLLYGGIFALIGLAISLLGMRQPQFVFAFWSGFLLIGPLLAMGLYRIAQLQDNGEPIELNTAMSALRGRLGSVAMFALLLSLIMIVWIRFSTLVAALYVGNITGSSSFISALGSPEGLGFIALLFGVGAIFAVVMFALTAWSLPLVLDGHANFGTAVVASVKATVEQPLPMILWGATVAGLTVIGMLTLFIGFVVIFPLLGYATWAAYRDLFQRR